jgi:hypothetical protein
MSAALARASAAAESCKSPWLSACSRAAPMSATSLALFAAATMTLDAFQGLSLAMASRKDDVSFAGSSRTRLA